MPRRARRPPAPPTRRPAAPAAPPAPACAPQGNGDLLFGQGPGGASGHPAHPHVTSVQDKGYAFVEFRSVEEASNAMALDGVKFRDAYLKVMRWVGWGGGWLCQGCCWLCQGCCWLLLAVLEARRLLLVLVFGGRLAWGVSGLRWERALLCRGADLRPARAPRTTAPCPHNPLPAHRSGGPTTTTSRWP